MNNFQRNIENQVRSNLFQGKTIIVYGARQVGKTTLVKKILQSFSGKGAYFDGEDPGIRKSFTEATVLELQSLLKGLTLVVIDEAQKIKNIGQTLKLLHDHMPEVQVIALGSSSFDLAHKVHEPLTGRKQEWTLYPISISELEKQYNRLEIQNMLPRLLIFGSYPETFQSPADKISERLLSLAESYIFKDVFDFQDIRNPEVLHKLLQSLALQLGQEVSFHELGGSLGINEATVERYIHLLEKAFIIFRLPALSRNPRKEIHKKKKIYFYDLGIRNALIRNFNDLELRNDVGPLWENFCIIERLKYLSAKGISPHRSFWRTYTQKEIDYIEEINGTFSPFECKWNPKKAPKLPKDFATDYPHEDLQTISPKNLFTFLED